MKGLNYVGWDVGGAHLKVASVDQSGQIEYAQQFATPLWLGLQHLVAQIPVVFEQLPKRTSLHIITMTAELVDIFNDRDDGVHQIIDIFDQYLQGRVYIYTTQSGFVDIAHARKKVGQIGSANWHASATLAASMLPTGIFIDLGSTTTDIIPFLNHNLANHGIDDQSRLQCDELVYTGMIRSPLMSLASKIPFQGKWQAIVAEQFATMADVYRILGLINAADDVMQSADGKPKDIQHSVMRLARMLGTDANKYNDFAVWTHAANYFVEMQMQLIVNAATRVISTDPAMQGSIIGAGMGYFLLKKIADRLHRPYISFSEFFKQNKMLKHHNTCASAVALALLYQRGQGN